jgi:hypothetical protein
MGLALMVVIWLITLVSTYFFVAKTWWLPVGAAEAAGFIDGQFALTFVLMGIVFLAAQLGLGYIVWESFSSRLSSDWATSSGSIASARPRRRLTIRTVTLRSSWYGLLSPQFCSSD